MGFAPSPLLWEQLKLCQLHRASHRENCCTPTPGSSPSPSPGTHGASPGAGHGHTGLGQAEVRAKGSPRCLKPWKRDREKAQSLPQQLPGDPARSLSRLHGDLPTEAPRSPAAPALAQPGQLMIPINNPDPEISDRSYNQSKVSPEAASQAGSRCM